MTDGLQYIHYRAEEGCRLNKTARPVFYREWAIYRDNWPRPLGEVQNARDFAAAPLREQVRGQVKQLRQIMGELKDVER